MNINNRLAKNDVKNTYDYSPRSIMKHQLREDPRRKKKGEGKRIKISNARNPMRSSRIHVVGLLSMIEPIVKSPIFHLCNETRAMVRPVERQREREKGGRGGEERDANREDSIDITRCNELGFPRRCIDHGAGSIPGTMTVFSRQKLQIETGDYESIIGVGRLRWSPCQEFLCRGISCRSKDNRENRNPFTIRRGGGGRTPGVEISGNS